MKSLISFLIIGLSLSLLTAQNRVEITEFKIKKKRVFNYKTDYRSHYHKRQFYFLDGKEYDGIIFENWKNGSLKQEFEVKKGMQDGFRRSFYKNGNIGYNYPEGKMEIGEHILGYHENGAIFYVHTVFSTEKDGYRLVTNTTYNNNGKVYEITTFKDGMPHGLHYLYDYQNGELRLITSYENGEKHGIETYYPPSGETIRRKWIHGSPGTLLQ